MASWSCECCREVKITTRPRKMAGYRLLANLCDQCAHEGHARQQCRKCLAEDGREVWVWHCARMQHAYDFHPGLIDRRLNSPDDPTPKPTHKYLGRILVPE